MFKRTQLCSALMVAFGGSLAIASLPSQAQQTLQRVEVTGSNIKRTDTETASPVQVLTRDDIERTGKQSIQEVLRGITADSQGSIPTSFSAGFASGSSAVSLRGLGVNSTLVLVNGRRMTTYGLADDGHRNSVDLKSIPIHAAAPDAVPTSAQPPREVVPRHPTQLGNTSGTTRDWRPRAN